MKLQVIIIFVLRNPNVDIGSLKLKERKKIVTRFEDECGVTSSGDRIFGGIITEIDEFPWLALFLYQPEAPNDLKHACGGCLIDSRFVLTAG